MKARVRPAAVRRWPAAAILLVIAAYGVCQAQSSVELPKGVKAVWDLAQAYREATPTRERICINGLWRWEPARDIAGPAPEGDWGYFKVPGFWPGLQQWQLQCCQTCFVHPAWKDTKLDRISAAWYQREITIPGEWAGRRIALSAEYVNSTAAVYVDGRKAGEIRFPAGEVDLTAQCRPGDTYTLSLLVIAMPLKAVMMSNSDTAAPKEVAGRVQRRGLCGDVYLVGTPAGPRIADVKVDTSVRRWEISFEAELQGLAADQQYSLRAEVADGGRRVRDFTGKPFTAGDLKDGRIAFIESWKPEKLWDTNTPQNMYQVSLSLLDSGGKALDVAAPIQFGFREFWIDGRDFYLNGSRIFLSAIPLDNAQIGAASATYGGVKETLLRMKSFGINFVYTHNYGCEPGTHVSFTEELRAADDVGMLVALSQPHFSQYDWKAPDADRDNGYARHAEFYVRVAQNHPSVVAYAMSHNATGYREDANPDMIDGIHGYPRVESWSRNGAERALRAQEIVKRLDPGRIVYHHDSGNLGAMYTKNFYPNFVPIQELDDWFEHWATVGVKPLFLCEFAAPGGWDFTMYRGWYRGRREFGSAPVPWELCLAEWNSQFFGEAAFRISEVDEQCLRWESKQFRSGVLWHRWDYPYSVGSQAFEEQYPVMAMYVAEEWRAFRTWGVSAFGPWEYSNYWKLRDGVKRGRTEFEVDWDHLQRPGFSPDYVDTTGDVDVATAFERSDWVPTPAAQAVMRNNMPLLAYIGGGPTVFISKDHNFRPGETVARQLIIINDSREPVTCDCAWSLGLPHPLAGAKQVAVGIGEQGRIPLGFELPAELAPGPYELTATVKFNTGESQQDSFTVNVMPAPAALLHRARIALFDPKDETGKLLAAMGAPYEPVDAQADLSGYDLLVIGKSALTVDGPAPDLARVRDGLRAVVFEQSSEALEKRLGFRTEEYGLRQVFKRVPDHPLLSGLDAENLHDWRGEATLLPPRMNYRTDSQYGDPTVEWCGIDVPHLWRCGCRGNVASVLIEKPARGDFLPILDGGYSLQYSPLMEYREGKGMVLFCQMDVTGRTESDPAAETLAANILRYASDWKPAPRREALYVGGPAGKRHLERAGITLGSYEGGKVPPGQVLVVGSGGGKDLAAHASDIAEFLKAGGNLLALGLDEQEANSFLPTPIRMNRQEHIASFFEPFGAGSLLAGVGQADVEDSGARRLPLVSAGAEPFGDGVLAKGRDMNVIFCQLPPYDVSRAEGAVASFQVDAGDAADGKPSALVTLGTTTEAGGQFGQRLSAAPQVGKSYTFAVSIKGVGGPVTAHLEVERAGSPWDRAVKGPDVVIPENEWTDLHVTFKCERPFPESWQAYVGCAQDGGRFRADLFRLYEGDYVPSKRPSGGPAVQAQAAPQNLCANPGFEKGSEPYYFQFVEQYNLRRTYRRASFLLTRLLADMGVGGSTPLLARFGSPVLPAKPEQRWLDGLYLDQVEAWDDPYRFFGW
jgi:hypothetical protein